MAALKADRFYCRATVCRWMPPELATAEDVDCTDMDSDQFERHMREAYRKKYHHQHGKPCPITGNPIPGGEISSLQDRPLKRFNACRSCCPWLGTIRDSLHDLNDRHGGDLKLTFNQLTDPQKDSARMMFFNAGPGDGYYYTVTGDGQVLSRNSTRLKETDDGQRDSQ